MNQYAEKCQKSYFQGRGKVRASKTIARWKVRDAYIDAILKLENLKLKSHDQ